MRFWPEFQTAKSIPLWDVQVTIAYGMYRKGHGVFLKTASTVLL